MDSSTFSAKLARNAEAMLKSGSTHVLWIGGAVVAYYLQLSDAEKLALETAFPILKGWTPFLAWGAAWLTARLKPSNAVTSQTQALIEELTRLKLDEAARKAGIRAPEPPTPPTSRVVYESGRPAGADPALEALRAIAPAAQIATLEEALRTIRAAPPSLPRVDFDPTQPAHPFAAPGASQ